MDNGLDVSYIRNIMWEDGTASTGPGLTCKSNITYSNGYSQEINWAMKKICNSKLLTTKSQMLIMHEIYIGKMKRAEELPSNCKALGKH